MGRGFVSGVLWGAAVSAAALLVTAQVGGRVSFDPPDAGAVEVPAGTPFDRARPDTAPVAPAADEAPAADADASRLDAPAGGADKPPDAESVPAAPPVAATPDGPSMTPAEEIAPADVPGDEPAVAPDQPAAPAQPAADAPPEAETGLRLPRAADPETLSLSPEQGMADAGEEPAPRLPRSVDAAQPDPSASRASAPSRESAPVGSVTGGGRPEVAVSPLPGAGPVVGDATPDIAGGDGGSLALDRTTPRVAGEGASADVLPETGTAPEGRAGPEERSPVMPVTELPGSGGPDGPGGVSDRLALSVPRVERPGVSRAETPVAPPRAASAESDPAVLPRAAAPRVAVPVGAPLLQGPAAPEVGPGASAPASDGAVPGALVPAQEEAVPAGERLVSGGALGPLESDPTSSDRLEAFEDEAMPGEWPDWVSGDGALSENAVAFDPPVALPLMAVLLLEGDGAAVKVGFPVTRVVGVSGASDQETELVLSLPDGDRDWVRLLDEAPRSVAVLVAEAENDTLFEAIARSGHGLVTYQAGDAVRQAAARAGVPVVDALERVDAEGRDMRAVQRFLDHAAFRAQRSGAVVVMARNTLSTRAALRDWQAQGRAEDVALAPVSAVLRAVGRIARSGGGG